jgi:FKBP-type peptidyl-prolyl cis-trans isomerase
MKKRKTPRYTLSPLAVILLFFIVFIALIASSQWGLWENADSGSEISTSSIAEDADRDNMILQITRPGEGPMPAVGDEVAIHYTAWLPNTQDPVIQTRAVLAEPISFVFGENNIIDGIENAVQVLRPGGQAVVYVPAMYAYGEKGNEIVPPNTDLVFLIDLISINK